MTEHDNVEFVISRTFDAPRDLVWKAMTEASRLAHWWGPKGMAMGTVKLDFRPGGTFHYSMKTPDGHEMWGKFVYREIDPQDSIVFINSFSDENGGLTRHPMSATWPLEVLNTQTFTENSGKTTVTLRGGPINASEEERQTFAGAFASMEQGFGGTFDQLNEYLMAAKTIGGAKAEFLRARENMFRQMESTPDDRLTWSPSPTARTPLHIVAHSAGSVQRIQEMFDGRPFPVPTMAEAQIYFRDEERQYTTREQVVSLLDKNSDAYVAWLDGLAPERLTSMIEAPFGLGQVPLAVALSFQALHMNGHNGQLEYIQTIYGDEVWH